MTRRKPGPSMLRKVLPSLRPALQGTPPGAFGLLVSLGGMGVSDLAFNLRHDLAPTAAVVAALAVQAFVGVVAVALLAIVRRTPTSQGVRVVLVVGVFVVAGVARTSVLVGLNPYPSWALWVKELAPRTIGALVWFMTSAVLLEWMNRAALQRMRLDTAYRQLLATRASTRAVLAEAEAELAEVMATTRAAIERVGDQLHTGITLAELDDCIRQVECLVDREVRPSSHSLARMPGELRSAEVPPLWPSTRVRVAALVRRWPTATPFQPDMVAALCLPVVVANVVTAPASVRPSLAFYTFLALALQLGAILLASWLLAPALRRMPRRAAIPLMFSVYVLLYAFGIWGLVVDASIGVETPLSAHLFPSVYALISGGAAAAAAQHRAESAAAERMIARIGHDLSRTRQQLWARRRRIATALHGRVQANLTAANLLLHRARDDFAAGGVLDRQLVEQVRAAMRFAWRIDARSPGTPRDRLLRVAQVWAGTMDVDLSFSEAAERRLDPDAADACVEVVREVLLNAARHAGATGASVSITPDEADLVRIVVREEGGRAPVGSTPGVGLGRSLLDSVTTSWSVHREQDARVTTLLLPTGRLAP